LGLESGQADLKPLVDLVALSMNPYPTEELHKRQRHQLRHHFASPGLEAVLLQLLLDYPEAEK
jgi:hypothetical protein